VKNRYISFYDRLQAAQPSLWRGKYLSWPNGYLSSTAAKAYIRVTIIPSLDSTKKSP